MTQDSVSHTMTTERYKYILDQKRSLNDNTFKIMSVYQALSLVAATGMFYVYRSWSMREIDSLAAALFSKIVVWIFVAISLIALVALVAGVSSWIKYKTEEIALEAAAGLPRRQPPRFVHAWRWYETYFVALIVILATVAPLMAFTLVIPQYS